MEPCFEFDSDSNRAQIDSRTYKTLGPEKHFFWGSAVLKRRFKPLIFIWDNVGIGSWPRLILSKNGRVRFRPSF
jgi:hypothetical protein